MPRKSKKAEMQEKIAGQVSAERERIFHILIESNIYTITLDPMIETYLDIFEVYQQKYLEWKEKGFPTMQRHTNKAGATNNSKHPLAQQVEIWSDKKMKALSLLGLTAKTTPRKQVVARSTARADEEILRPRDTEDDELTQFRDKWRQKKLVSK